MAKTIYEVTKTFPQFEQYGLSSQMQRAVVSVASNIAEGAARSGQREFLQFINIAQGSLSELDTQIEIAKRLGYMNGNAYEEMLNELQVLSKQLYGLSRSIRNKQKCGKG